MTEESFRAVGCGKRSKQSVSLGAAGEQACSRWKISRRGRHPCHLDIFRGEETYGFKVCTTDCPLIPLAGDYERLLTESGFRTVRFYGSCAFDLYHKHTSAHLIVVAQK
jgi:hypothetical protein